MSTSFTFSDPDAKTEYLVQVGQGCPRDPAQGGGNKHSIKVYKKILETEIIIK